MIDYETNIVSLCYLLYILTFFFNIQKYFLYRLRKMMEITLNSIKKKIVIIFTIISIRVFIRRI